MPAIACRGRSGRCPSRRRRGSTCRERGCRKVGLASSTCRSTSCSSTTAVRPSRARRGPPGRPDQRHDDRRAPGPASRDAAPDPARLGRALGAPDHAVGARHRVPAGDLRGRWRVEPAGCVPAPRRARVGLRPERPARGPDRVRRVRPRARRRDLDQLVDPAPARHDRRRAGGGDLVRARPGAVRRADAHRRASVRAGTRDGRRAVDGEASGSGGRGGRTIRSLARPLVALLAIALVFRAQVIAIGPLLPSIQAGLGISHGVAGALSAIPVLCMGIFAPLAPLLATAIGRTLGARGVRDPGHRLRTAAARGPGSGPRPRADVRGRAGHGSRGADLPARRPPRDAGSTGARDGRLRHRPRARLDDRGRRRRAARGRRRRLALRARGHHAGRARPACRSGSASRRRTRSRTRRSSRLGSHGGARSAGSSASCSGSSRCSTTASSPGSRRSTWSAAGPSRTRPT